MRILVTGGAGFIGSNLTDTLLAQGHHVVVLDNFITGKHENLTEAASHPSFTLIEGDIRDFETCRKAAENCEAVFHEAALGAVPRSIANPQMSFEINSQGFCNMIEAARLAGVRRFIYASSSSVYGDNARMPKVENSTGNALSPYALSKQMNESVAAIYSKVYRFPVIGLRYFNVFGKRQDPAGAYAAVIPKFVLSMLNHKEPVINGTGEFSRDFTFIENIVQLNLCALNAPEAAWNTVYNGACGERTTLKELFYLLREELSVYDPEIRQLEPKYGPERAGDIPHSLADISKAVQNLHYQPQYDIKSGLHKAVEWYCKK